MRIWVSLAISLFTFLVLPSRVHAEFLDPDFGSDARIDYGCDRVVTTSAFPLNDPAKGAARFIGSTWLYGGYRAEGASYQLNPAWNGTGNKCIRIVFPSRTVTAGNKVFQAVIGIVRGSTCATGLTFDVRLKYRGKTTVLGEFPFADCKAHSAVSFRHLSLPLNVALPQLEQADVPGVEFSIGVSNQGDSGGDNAIIHQPRVSRRIIVSSPDGLESALSEAKDGEEIFLPKSDYYVEKGSFINNRKYLSIVGEDARDSRVLYSVRRDLTGKLVETPKYAFYVGSNVNDILFRNFTIEGPFNNPRDTVDPTASDFEANCARQIFSPSHDGHFDEVCCPSTKSECASQRFCSWKVTENGGSCRYLPPANLWATAGIVMDNNSGQTKAVRNINYEDLNVSRVTTGLAVAGYCRNETEYPAGPTNIVRSNLHDIFGTRSGRGYGVIVSCVQNSIVEKNVFERVGRHSYYNSRGYGPFTFRNNLIIQHRMGRPSISSYVSSINVGRSSNVAIIGNFHLLSEENAISIAEDFASPSFNPINFNRLIGNYYWGTNRPTSDRRAWSGYSADVQTALPDYGERKVYELYQQYDRDIGSVGARRTIIQSLTSECTGCRLPGAGEHPPLQQMKGDSLIELKTGRDATADDFVPSVNGLDAVGRTLYVLREGKICEEDDTDRTGLRCSKPVWKNAHGLLALAGRLYVALENQVYQVSMNNLNDRSLLFSLPSPIAELAGTEKMLWSVTRDSENSYVTPYDLSTGKQGPIEVWSTIKAIKGFQGFRFLIGRRQSCDGQDRYFQFAPDGNLVRELSRRYSGSVSIGCR